MAEHDGLILHELREIRAQLTRIEKQQEHIMSGLTDLQNEETAEGVTIGDLLTEVATFITDVLSALANTDSDAAVEAASQLLTTQQGQVQQAIATLQAADPANPTPDPAPSAG